MGTLLLTLIYILYCIQPCVAFLMMTLWIGLIFFNKNENFINKIIKCMILSAPIYGISILGDKLNHLISFSMLFIVGYSIYIFKLLYENNKKNLLKLINISLPIIIILLIGSFFTINDKITGILRIVQTLIVIIPIIGTFYAKKNIKFDKNTLIDFELYFNHSISATVLLIIFQCVMHKTFGISLGYIFAYTHRVIYNGLCNAASVISIFIGQGIIYNYYKIINGKFKKEYLFRILLFLVGIIINTSRTGIVGAVIVCFIMTLKKANIKNNTTKNKKIVFLPIIGFIAISLLYFMLASKLGRNELTNAFSLNGRLETYEYGFSKIFSTASTFIFGNGLDPSIYYDGHLPHNIFIESLMEIGIIGTLLITFVYSKILLRIKNTLGKYYFINIIICCMFITGFLSIQMYTIIFIYSIIMDCVIKQESTKKKRILEYIPGYNVGGIESLMSKIFEEKNLNIQYDLLIEVDLDDRIQKELVSYGINIIRIDNITKENTFKHFHEVNKIMKNNNYDVVHSHEISTRIAVLYYANKYKVKTRILHSHSVIIENANIIKKITAKYNMFNANKYVACSKEASKIFGKRNVEIISNGIEPKKFMYDSQSRTVIRNKYNIDSETYVLVQVGRLSEVKNYKFMIDVFEKIPGKTKYFIIGDGEQKEPLKNIIKEKKLTNKVIMTGNISNVQDYLSAADLYVMPSISEGFAIGALESQANGLISIVSDTIPCSIKKTDRIWFESLEKEKWIKKIIELKNNKNENRDKYVKYIEESDYNIDCFKKKIYKLYNCEMDDEIC